MADQKPAKFKKEKQFIRDKQIDDLKVPPHSLEAEQSVLGSVLIEKDAIIKMADKKLFIL